MAVGDLITTAYRKQYDDVARQMIMQTEHLLEGTYVKDTLKGEEGYADYFGKTTLRKKTERFQQKERLDVDQSRRKYVTNPYWGCWSVDNADRVRMAVDPTSPFMKSIQAAVAVHKDQLIIDSFEATAYTGKDGTTPVSFLASQIIANGGTGITMAKLKKVRRLFKDNDMLTNNEPIYFLWSPEGEEQALGLTEITSNDYNTTRVLVNGSMTSFMGMEYRLSNLLPKSGNIRSCYAWVPSAIQMAISEDVKTNIYQDTNLVGDPWTCSIYMDMGATRMDEKKVVKIEIQEA